MDEQRLVPAASLEPESDIQGTIHIGDAPPSATVYSSDLNKYYLDSSLEVKPQPHASVQYSSREFSGLHIPDVFGHISRRKVMVVSTIITLLVTLITGASVLLFARNAPERGKSAQPLIQTQDISLKNAEIADIPQELQGAEQTLLVNGDVVTKRNLKVVSGAYTTTLKTEDLTGSQTLTLPNATGTLCLDSNNCGFATSEQITALQTQLGLLGEPGLQSITSGSANLIVVNDGNGNITISQTAQTAGVDSVNGAAGAIMIQGTPNRITVNPSGNTFTLSTPQDINVGASPTFVGLTLTGLNCSALTNNGSLTTNGSGQLICDNDDGGATGVTGSGTVGVIPLFTGASQIGDSIISQALGVVSVAGDFSVGATDVIFANTIQQTSNGQDITITAGNDMVTITAGGRSFDFPTSGPGTQTICTTGISCVAGGGQAVLLAPGSAQTNNTADSSIFINNTGAGNLLQLQTGGSDEFVIANNGNTTINGNVNIGANTLQGTTAVINFNNFDVDGSGNVTAAGTLNIQGGTATFGTSTGSTGSLVLHDNDVVGGETITISAPNVTASYSLVLPTAAGTQYQCLKYDTGGQLIWDNCDGGLGTGGVTTLNTLSGALTILGTANEVDINTSAPNITIGLPSNVTIGNNLTVTSNLTLSALANGFLEVNGSGVLSVGVIDLGTDTNGNYVASLTAGNGLTGTAAGEGTTPTLAVGAGNGITVNADDITLSLQANKGLEVDVNGLSLVDCSNGQILKYNGSNQWACAADAGGSGVGDTIQVNGTGVNNDVNILNTSATGSVPATTWALVGGSPDQLTLAIGAASASDAGVVTTNGQTFAGNKTFSGQINANGNITLEAGDTFMVNGDSFTDLTGNGLQTSGNALILSVQANKGLEVDANGLSLVDCSNGQILKYNGSNQWACAADSSGGAGTVGGSGTNGRIARFTPDGNTIGDSSITDNGTDATATGDFVIQGGDLTLGAGTGSTGSIVLHDNDGVGTETVTLVAPNITTSYTLTLPTAAGTQYQCLKYDTGGQLIWDNCDGGSGGSGGVTTLNTLSGAVTIQGTANEVDVSTSSPNITVGLPNNVTIGNNLTVTNGLTLSSLASGFLEVDGSGVVSVGTINLGADTAGDYIASLTAGNGLTGTASGEGSTPTLAVGVGNGLSSNTDDITLVLQANKGLEVDGNGLSLIDCSNGQILKYNGSNQWACAADTTGGSGTIDGGGTGGRIARFTPDGDTLGDSSLTDNGTNATATGDFIIQGGDVTFGTGTGSVATLVLHDNDAVGSETVTLTLPNVTTSYTLTLPTAAGTQYQCLKYDTGGQLIWDNCDGGSGGGSGVTSLRSLTGALSLVSGDTDRVTVNDNGSNTITLSGPQDINTTSAPSFAGLTLTGNLQLNSNILQGGNAEINFTNFDVEADGDIITAGDIAVNGGNVTSSGALTVNSTSADLTFSTVTSGNIVIDGAGNLSVQDAATFASTATFNGVSTFNTDVDMTFAGSENLAITTDLVGTVNAISLIATPSGSAGTTRGIFIQQANSANAQPLDTAILIDNADTDLSMTTGILIQGTTLANSIVTAIDVSDPEIATAINVGANDIIGTTAVINFDNFDIDGSGNLIAAGTGVFSGASVTIGATALQGNLVLNDGNGGQTATIRSANQAANRIISIPIVASDADFCLSTGNCAGSGAGVTQSGTNANGQIAYFTSGNNITSSTAFTFNGTDLTLANDLNVNGDDIFSDGNLSIQATGYVRIGDSGTPGVATADDELYVQGDLEVDANTDLGGTLTVAGLLQASANFQVNGNSTLGDAVGDTTDVNGSFATKKGADYSTTGSANNVNFGDASLIRLTGASTQTITGIAGGRDGENLTLVNTAAQAAVFVNNSGSSSAGNQIITGTGSNLTLAAGASITLIYDSSGVAATSFWRVIGDSAGSLCSSCANTSLSNLSSTDISQALNRTGGNLALQTTTSGDITMTTAVATGLVNVLTGNLKVGNGTPGLALNGEDTYIEGTLEVDSAVQFDSSLAVASGITITAGDLALTAGNLTTGGTQRLSNAGALSNITGYSQTSGTFAFSGAGNFSLDSSAFDVTTGGAVSGVTTLSTSGIITVGSLGAATTPVALCRNASNQISSCGVNSAGVTLQQAYDADADSSAATITTSAADGMLVFSNPASGGSTQPFVLEVEQLLTGGAQGGLFIDHRGGPGSYALRVDDSSGDTTPFVIDEDGDIGIKTTDTSRGEVNIDTGGTGVSLKRNGGAQELNLKFNASNGSTVQSISSSLTLESSGDLVVQTNGTNERLRVESGGNVGIGDTTPDAKFDIDATFNPAGGTTSNTGSGLTVTNTANKPAATTDTTYGQQINITRTGVTNAATINTYGLDIQATGDTGGTSTLYGLNVNVSGADNNYAAIFQGGNVGIGTATPGYQLDVRGTTSSQIHLTDGSTDAGAYLLGFGGTGAYLTGGAAYNGASWVAKATTAGQLITLNGEIRFFSDSSLTVGNTFTPTERLVIQTDGDVGIGITPDERLHVSGSGAGSGAHISDAYLGTWDGGGGYAVFTNNSVKTTSTSYAVLQDGSGQTFVNSASGQDLHLRVANADVVTILSTGNVGIGDTTPDARLDVEPTGAVTATSYAQQINNLQTNVTTDSIDKYGLYISSTGAFTGAGGTATNNYGLFVATPTGGDNNYAAIFQGGNVGIGTATPTYKLDINQAAQAASEGLRISQSGSNAINIYGSTGGANYIDLSSDSANIRQTYVNGYLNITSSRDITLQTSAANLGNINLDAGSTGNSVIFKVNGTEGARLNSTGNFGIGDISPAAALTVGNGDLFQVQSTGEVRTINGTANAPAYSFTGDTTTGIFRSGTNEIAISVAGATRAVFTTDPSILAVSASSTNKGLVIRGAASQTADLMQFQNSSLTVLGGVLADGSVVSGDTTLASSYSRLVSGSGLAVRNQPGNQNFTIVANGADVTYNISDGADPHIFAGGGNELASISSTGVSIGNTALQGQLLLHDGSGGQTVTIRSLNQAANRTVEIPIISGNDTFCLVNANNCAGSATTLQTTYDTDTNGGDAIITLTSADGAILFRDNATPLGTTLFAVQNSAGSTSYLSVSAALVTVSTALRVGDTTNGISFNDQAANQLRYRGTARNDRVVSLRPEFEGAILRGDGSANVGYMISDICSDALNINDGGGTAACDTGQAHSYYEWTTAEGSSNDYDVYVRWKLPSDFDASSGFANNITLNIFGWRTNSSDSILANLYNDEGGVCGTADQVVASSDTDWSNLTFAGMTGDADCEGTNDSSDILAGEYVTFRFRMTADNSEIVRLGEIEISYKSNF